MGEAALSSEDLFEKENNNNRSISCKHESETVSCLKKEHVKLFSLTFCSWLCSLAGPYCSGKLIVPILRLTVS